MSFLNKVILVTGASSGIGKSNALHFAKLSARLCLVDKDGANLKKTAEDCEKLSRAKVFTAAVDLRNDDIVEKVVQDIMKEFGRIDVVINCAGIYKYGKILDPDAIEVFDDIMAINLRSVVRMTNVVAPILVESQGCIINISSASAVLTTQEYFAYSVAKASLCHFSKCVAYELALKGVRVNCILPGAVNTNILFNSGLSRQESDAFWSKGATMHPLGYIAKAEEIAELAAYLASDKAKSMTGANYLIDCGFSLLG